MSAAALTEPAASPWASVHLLETRPSAAELEHPDVRVSEINGDAIDSKLDLMAALADVFRFPDYFGANWDAVDECLRELESWVGPGGHLLLVSAGDSLWRREPELCGLLARAWIDVAGAWIERGIPFHLAFCAGSDQG